MIDTVVILAGGLATRLKPITESIPKSMIEICGEPFISHQLKLLKKNNIKNVILCLGHLCEKIQDYVGDGSNWGLNIRYSFDGSKLLGTGGALRSAIDLLPQRFFVLYGDSYLDIDYSVVADFCDGINANSAVMTVYRNEGRYDSSNVEFRGGVLINYDKTNKTELMEYIDYGLGILPRIAIETIPPDEKYDLADLYVQLQKQGKLEGYEVYERFYEIGSINGIDELEIKLKGENHEL